jgi:hypothetical protein
MAKRIDDLEAVRTVTTALGGFSPEEQERIIRWAREKLGLSTVQRPHLDARTPQQPPSPAASPRPGEPTSVAQPPASARDLKTFVNGKNPKNDIQFAATVAYFYRFEAPPEQRRNEIDAAILQDACRLASRKRFKNPLTTLNNSKSQGLLDSGTEAGKFVVNTVGENLVAMTLPSQSGGPVQVRKPTKPAKKTARKKK